VSLGSGGRDFAGGGAVRLDVGGTVTIDGSIRADGVAPDRYWGGSGGSVYFTTGWLTGSGTIRANGGGATWDYAAGGAGGRVAIVLTGRRLDSSPRAVARCSVYARLSLT
jgi:hypothetical protein